MAQPVRIQAPDQGPAESPAALEVLVREPVSGRVLVRILLQAPADPDTPVRMHLSPATPGAGAQDAAVLPSPVAGRIDARPSDLTLGLDAWCRHLLARKKKPRSVTSFRQVIQAAAKDKGWTACTDLTFAAVSEYMDAKVTVGDWKGTTYNRNLSAFRSLTKYLKKTRVLAEDPLCDADRAEDDGEDGARAAQLDEARALLKHAWIRGEADRRCKGDRALFWACWFEQAGRAGEPEQWVWKRHVFLDEAHPYIRWTKDINKNGKDQDVPLTPELAALLRRHRDRMRELARTKPAFVRKRAGGSIVRRVDPDDPEAFVFPVVPPRCTFRHDRDAVGIPAVDSRGRRFSPQSARKFFSTVLTAQGVPEKMVDRLMRHSGGVEGRYYDPPMAEMAAAVARLPRLWPGECGLNVDKAGGPPVDLTNRRGLADDGTATSTEPLPATNSANPPSPWPRAVGVATSGKDAGGLGGLLECSMPAPPGMVSFWSVPVGSLFSLPFNPVMPISGSINADSTAAIADLFEAIARVLRNGAPHASLHAPQGQPRTGPAA
jgi:integrase